MAKKNIPTLSVGNDPSWTLEQWKDFIDNLIYKYGDKSVLSTDAGPNNVELLITERPIIKKEKS